MMRRVRWIAAAGTLAAALALVAASRPEPEHAKHVGARPTPAPTFKLFSTASRKDMLTYARSLTFNADYHASESRRLMHRVGGTMVAGPLATVSPEIGNTSMSIADLEAGRIVARVTTDGVFPAQGFAKGENYVWVDKVNGELRAVIIPADPTAPTKEFGFRNLHKYVNPPGTPAEARFRWNDFDLMDTVWVSCPFGCCEVLVDGHGRPRPPASTK